MHRIAIFVYYVNLVVSLALAFCTDQECLNCPSENQDPYISEYSASNEEHSLSVGKFVSRDIQYVNLESFQFFCRASYPVEWEFEGKDFSSVSLVQSRVYVDHILNPSKTCYETILSTSIADDSTSVTGNYTCRSVDGTKSVSFYRYSYSSGKKLSALIPP